MLQEKKGFRIMYQKTMELGDYETTKWTSESEERHGAAGSINDQMPDALPGKHLHSQAEAEVSFASALAATSNIMAETADGQRNSTTANDS